MVGILGGVSARVGVVVAVLAVLAAGCGGGEHAVAWKPGCGGGSAIEGRPVRVATTVGGSGTVVTGIVPEGVNSHTYEPAPSVAATLEDADVVFLNGLGLEEPTKALALANIGDDAVLCELGTTVLPKDQYVYDF